MTPVTVLLSACVGCYIVYRIFLRQLFSPHRRLPSARQRFVLFRLFHEPTTFELEQWMKEVPNDGLVRYFGFMNEERLLMTDLDVLKLVMQRESYKFDKISWLAAIQYPADVSGLVSAKGELHKFHRRHTIAAFNSNFVRTLYPQIWEAVVPVSDTLSHEAVCQRTTQMNGFLQRACLHTAVRAAFSLDIDVIGDSEQHLVESYRHPFKVGESAPLFSKLLQLLPEPLQHPGAMLIAKSRGIDISAMMGLMKRTVHERLEDIKQSKLHDTPAAERANPTDLLGSLLWKGQPYISERALLKHAKTTLAAALEMVSNQLSWAIYALSHPQNQDIQEQLRSEIRTRFPCPPESLTWEDIDSLPYLVGTVNEVLRLYPNVSHRSRLCNTATSFKDVPIPKGTILTWPTYAINRDPKYWSPDADVFRPERWCAESSKEERPSHRDAFSFMTFAQGPRKCPGEHYARAVLSCMLLALVGRYRFSRPENHPDVIEDDNARRIGFGIVMKADIWADVDEVPGWVKV